MLDRIAGIASNDQLGLKVSSKPKPQAQIFNQVLQQKKAAINVSKHAQQRLVSRNLQLKQEDIHQLSTAMNELQAKGSKESLLVYKNMGIIANVQNRTIITAMGMNELGTVTNIDSTKFIK